MSLDAYAYFGTDDLYLNYLARFVKPGGAIGMAGAGLMQEFEGTVPEHLKEQWTQDFWAIHSLAWWRRHWERTGIVAIELAETMPEAWRLWRDWLLTAHPENPSERSAVEADQGRYLGWFRLIGRRNAEARLEDYCWPATFQPFSGSYEPRPLLKEAEGSDARPAQSSS